MSETSLEDLHSAEKRTAAIKKIAATFTKSSCGRFLKKQVRWSRYRPEHVSEKAWAALIGGDAYSLSHMELARQRMERFLKQLPPRKHFFEQDEGYLLLTAAIHDWGKCAYENLASGDIDWELKTSEHIAKEQETFKRLFDEYVGSKEVKLKYIIEQTVFNSSGRLGEVFSAVERLGYMETALLAYGRSRATDDRVLANHLRWLCAGVLSNHLTRLIELARSYEPVKHYLKEHAKNIDDALECITPGIFADHGQNEKIRQELYAQAQAIWSGQDLETSREDTHKRSFDRGIFGQGTNFHKRFISDYDVIERIAESCRVLGLHVVLTSGSYDLLHIGHVKYLEKARGYGDILFVGLDSDKKITHRKGPHRPIVSEQERLEMLSHVRHVDVVALKTPEHKHWELIGRIRPDTLVATAETYTPDEIRELERLYCGKVVILEPQGTSSTSAKIRRLQIGWEKRFLHPIRDIMASEIDNEEKMRHLDSVLTEVQDNP